MASSADEVPTKDEGVNGEPRGVSSDKELRNALYAKCADFEEENVFTQDELIAFDIIPDNSIEKLQEITKQLANDGLFKVMKKDSKPCWKVVKRADALKYLSLTKDEALVYLHIEGAAREGIWSRMLRLKTKLHMTTVNHAVKSLENKNMIKAVKLVRWPNRKTYMLAKLQPSENVTGGPFYTDGALDEEFVHQMSLWTERYIIGRSWWHPPLPENKKKSSSKTTQEQHGRDRSKDMLPLHPGYGGYPTLSEVTRAINRSGLSDLTMKESEMGQILDVLCWDGRLERIRHGKAYRAVRQVDGEDGVDLGNGLTESPCGRCPVFEFCEEGGPVNAKSCEYFQEWLQY